jgi:aminopeptidase N
VKCFEDANGCDLGHFRLWYSQAGTPELVCSFAYDERRKDAELTVEQLLPPTPGQPDKKPLHVPLKLGLLGGNGQDLELRLTSGDTLAGGVASVTKKSQRFCFIDVPSRPVPSLLRGFSAPVRLTIDLSDRDLEFLMANDSDLFNRWQAANEFATRTLVHLARAPETGKRSPSGLAYARALAAPITDERLEPAYRAELLRLPTEADIAREIAHNVDPGAIHRARKRLSRLVGTTLAPQLEPLYATCADTAAFSPDPTSAGRRALRNTALTLLSARGTPRDKARLAEHYWSATNMTDMAHALFILASDGGAEGKKALDHFFERWKADHLVIDTWFTAQAISPRAATLGRVRTLTKHPLFSLTAPNKVRALIGSFATQNLVQFNRPDGAGYAFLTEQVLALDRFNPQIAARMLGCLRSWRSLEHGRRNHAKRALQQIAKTRGLSRDVYEIVSKMLD